MNRQRNPELVALIAAMLGKPVEDIGHIVILVGVPEGTRLLHTYRDAAEAMDAVRGITVHVAHDLTGREN